MLKNNHINQERKTLHKVKRQWVILSAVTLLGTAGITSINVNAASNLASDTKTTSSLANTTAGYSNATATLGQAASNALNRLNNNISAINSYASSRTTLSDDDNSQASAAISSLVSSAQSESLAAKSAYNQIKVANVIASAANMPGGTLDDAARAASQASAAFNGLMTNLANTDRLVGNMSDAVNQVVDSDGSSDTTSVASTSSAATTKHSKTSSTADSTDASSAASSDSSDDSTSQSANATASDSAVSAAKQSIATAKHQLKAAKTAKAKAKATKLLKRAQKNLLIVQNNYNYKYYYYFDGPFDTVTTKKPLYVYSKEHLVKQYRIKKIPKGTTISVFKVLTDDNSSVFKVTGGNYITGKKSFFSK